VELRGILWNFKEFLPILSLFFTSFCEKKICKAREMLFKAQC
jgi:hypothetical protein